MPREGTKLIDWFNSEEEFERELEQADIRAKSEFEIQFIEDTRRRYYTYKMDSFMSSSQMDLFNKIRSR